MLMRLIDASRKITEPEMLENAIQLVMLIVFLLGSSTVN